MRSFRLGAFLVLTILVGAVAAVAYNLGLSAGAADVAIAAGASVIYAPASISPFAIIFGGFLLLLFIGFLAKVIAGPRHHAAYGPWGRRWGPAGSGGWDGENVPEQVRPMLERWHQRSHADSGSRPPSGGPAGGGASPGTRVGQPTPPPSWRPPGGPNYPTDQPPTGA